MTLAQAQALGSLLFGLGPRVCELDLHYAGDELHATFTYTHGCTLDVVLDADGNMPGERQIGGRTCLCGRVR